MRGVWWSCVSSHDLADVVESVGCPTWNAVMACAGAVLRCAEEARFSGCRVPRGTGVAVDGFGPQARREHGGLLRHVLPPRSWTPSARVAAAVYLSGIRMRCRHRVPGHIGTRRRRCAHLERHADARAWVVMSLRRVPRGAGGVTGWSPEGGDEDSRGSVPHPVPPGPRGGSVGSRMWW